VHVFSFLILIVSCTSENIVYISPDGNDGNPGTLDKPIATIEKARDMVNNIKNEKGDDARIMVYLKGGTYHVSSTIEFAPEDSGTIDFPVLYQNYNAEEVILSGGKNLKASEFEEVNDSDILHRVIHKEARDKILMYNLKDHGITDYGKFKQQGFSTAILPAQMELFINDKPMEIARWPNKGTEPIPKVIDPGSIPKDLDFSDRGGKVTYDYNRAKYWQEADDIWVWGYFGRGFADDNLRIENINREKKTIKFEQATMFGIKPSDPDDEWAGKIIGYHVYNLLEEIDMPGEYYIDRETGILYLYPPEDFEEADIMVTMLEDPLLAVENTSNVIFQGLTFEGGRGMGIYLEGGNNIQFKGCKIRNFGTIAVMMGKGIGGTDKPIHEFTAELVPRRVGNLKAHQYENTGFSNNAGTNHAFISCDMYNLSAGGMLLSGGNRKTLEPGNNLVENCRLYSFNRRNKTYTPGITLWGVGNIIRHCHIYDAPQQAIAIFGNEHLIELNHIEKVVKVVHDNGAIYIGRNPSERGNRIINNYFADIGAPGFKNCALHLDDGASEVLIEGNIFYKASRSDFGDVVINGGSDHVIKNNVFAKGAHAIWIENPVFARTPERLRGDYGRDGLWGKRLFEAIDINSEAWKEKYPGFNPWSQGEIPDFLQNLKCYNNVIFDEEIFISKHDLDSGAFKVWENNLHTSKNPGFVNIEEENFTIEDGSVIYDRIPDFKPIPMERIGLYEDEFRK